MKETPGQRARVRDIGGRIKLVMNEIKNKRMTNMISEQNTVLILRVITVESKGFYR